MAIFKKVSRDSLETFKFLLESYTNHEDLLKYFNDNILEVQKEKINDFKKEIYESMIKAEPEKSEKLKDLYDNFKNGNLSFDQAQQIFIDIL